MRERNSRARESAGPHLHVPRYGAHRGTHRSGCGWGGSCSLRVRAPRAANLNPNTQKNNTVFPSPRLRVPHQALSVVYTALPFTAIMSLRASATSASSSAPQRGEFLQQTLQVRSRLRPLPKSAALPQSLTSSPPSRQAWQPIITPRTLYVVFLSLAIPFIAIGAAIIDASSKVVEHSWQYDGAGNTNPNCAVGMTGLSSQEAKVCTLEWTADRDLAAPIFVYYGLDNFYQNHRRYVKSKSDTQLAGTIYSSSGDTGISDCSPAISNNGKVLHPCGLIANSFFNGAARARPVRGTTGAVTNPLSPPLPPPHPPPPRSRKRHV